MHKTAYAMIGVGAALEIADYYNKAGSTNSPTLDSVMNFNESISSSIFLHVGVLLIVAGTAILVFHKGAS